MNEAIWIFLCLFASIGIAQCICWLAARRKQKGTPLMYQVIPLYDSPSQLEGELRDGIDRLDWTGAGDRILLVDMGLSGESRVVCENFLRRYPGILICRPEEIGGLLRGAAGAGELQDTHESGIL